MTNNLDLKNLDDLQLIKFFVQGETRVLSSNNLRLEYKMGTSQLTTVNNNEVIAIFKPLTKPRSIFLKEESKYRDLISNTLLESKFIPIGLTGKYQGLFEYQQYDIPHGYRANYTDTITLWKNWWPNRRHQRSYAIMIDILIFVRDEWYPIQDMVGHDGIFYIKTLVAEISLGSTDKIVWLNKGDKSQTNIPVPSSSLTTSTGKNLGEKFTTTDAKNWYEETYQQAGSTSIHLDDDYEPLEKPMLKISQEMKEKALKILEEYLVNGEIEKRSEIIKDGKGEVQSMKMITVKKPCPQWVIEFLLKN
jgi:hypothetical protein